MNELASAVALVREFSLYIHMQLLKKLTFYFDY